MRFHEFAAFSQICVEIFIFDKNHDFEPVSI